MRERSLVFYSRTAIRPASYGPLVTASIEILTFIRHSHTSALRSQSSDLGSAAVTTSTSARPRTERKFSEMASQHPLAFPPSLVLRLLAQLSPADPDRLPHVPDTPPLVCTVSARS